MQLRGKKSTDLKNYTTVRASEALEAGESEERETKKKKKKKNKRPSSGKTPQ